MNNMTDFARDLKEMMAAWDKYRAIWIKKHGNDEGFAKWYQEQIAGLERKAKTDSRLSAICDRELFRVGLAARYEILDDSEVKIAEADSLSDARYAAEKAEKSGQRRVMIYDTTTGKTVAF